MNEVSGLGLVLDQVSKDKNIDRKVLVEALEQAILTAAKRAFGMHREMEAKFNEANGRVDLFQIVKVVPQVTVPGNEMTLEDAHKFDPDSIEGDELLFQIFYDEKDQAKAEEQDAKYGHVLQLNRAWKTFGRIAAQTAKQVILQRVREAERENVFNQYRDKRGELISGIVRRFERGNIIVDLGGAEAVLPVREQVPRESYRAGRPHRGLRGRHRQGGPGPANHHLARAPRAAREAVRDRRSRRSTTRSSASRPRRGSRAPARRSPSARAIGTSIRWGPAWA